MNVPIYRRLAGSFQFLTALPIRGETASPAEAAAFFPVAGAAIGASAGIVVRYAGHVFGTSLASLLGLAWLVFLTGGLHEDGLADIADAVRAGRSRERMLEILKDSRIGTYGALALIVFFLLRWQAIENITVPAVAGVAIAGGLSRASMVILAGSTPPAVSGLGATFAKGCDRAVVLAVTLQCAIFLVAFGWYCGWQRGLALIAVCAAVIWTTRGWLQRRLGGVNGDCFGATCVAVETAVLLVLAWRKSF
jgi:adenosylcobinamide-GDP ribazoletransferase